MALAWIESTLADLAAHSLLRELRAVESGAGPQIVLQGRTLLNFASNNYLDLASHPVIRVAVKDAVDTWGWGAGASQLVSGYTTLHAELCQRLAEFEQTEDAVLFPTGFQANVGTITALVGKGDRVILDKLCHASIVDGARLSGAEVRVFGHGDVAKLARLLESRGQGAGTGGQGPATWDLRPETRAPRRTLVVTDSIFSMDGDLAPLAETLALCEAHGAMLMVDEAHATGVLGPGGRGAVEHLGLKGRVPVLMGTLSKALGGVGGFVAGTRALCDHLRNRARSQIYTTALPPAAAAASLAALRLVHEEPWRREQVCARAAELRERFSAAGLNTVDGSAAIVPLIVGEADKALALAACLLEEGILCPAIRPPTVPKGTSRLRFSLMASHTEADVERVADVVITRLREG